MKQKLELDRTNHPDQMVQIERIDRRDQMVQADRIDRRDQMAQADRIDQRDQIVQAGQIDDAALWKMIQEIEDGELLRAPAYLKQEILDAVEEAQTVQENARNRREQNASGQKASTQSQRYRTGGNKLKRRLEWIGYALEVGAVTAAAVALVLMMPVQDQNMGWDMGWNMGWNEVEQDPFTTWDPRYDRQWEEKAEARQQISDAASALTEKIVTWGSFLLPGEEEDIR